MTQGSYEGNPARVAGAGFLAQRTPGFAQHASSQIGFSQHVTETHAARGPQVGFAAALRQGSMELEGTPRSVTSKQFPNKDDKEARRRYREKPASAPRLPRLVAGRRVDLSKRGSDWKPFVADLERKNPHGFRAVEAGHLVLRFMTGAETESMLSKRFDGGEALRDSRVKRNLTAMIMNLNQFVSAEQERESKEWLGLLCELPSLTQRASDPLGSKWADPDRIDAGYDDEEVAPQYLWQPAGFEAGRVGQSGPSAVTIEVEDPALVLRQARNRFVDRMEVEGFDVSGVEGEWRPQVEVLHTIGGRSLEGMQVHVPGYPLILPLKAPHISEL